MKQFGLTEDEQAEFKRVKDILFKGQMFVIFTKEEEESEEMKIYNRLLEKKHKHIKLVQEKFGKQLRQLGFIPAKEFITKHG